MSRPDPRGGEPRRHRATATGGALVVAVVVLVSWPDGGHAAPRGEHRYDGEIAAAVREARGRFAVPSALVKAVIRQESAFDPRAVSRAGARGLMQVMPSTAARLDVRADRLFDPQVNIRAGVALLSTLLERYEGDVIATLVAYNAGPRGRFTRLPRNGETPAYVWRVLGFYERYSAVERQRGVAARASPDMSTGLLVSRP